LDRQDYGFGDRLLHRLALGITPIARASFDIDALVSGQRDTNEAGRHVFVSGLARAGTTILMRTLYETGAFCSLTYRDMPFVLMPCLWKRMSRPFRHTREASERAHGDGIQVNFDSPEAFEEVFWRIFCAPDYIAADHLRPHDVDDEVLDAFRAYVQRIVACADNRGPERYLSKNNNNLLRLGALRQAFPGALIVIPFRDPLQHARSLYNQDRKFRERHAADTFSRDYMRWLGHHEFGLTHKPFRFTGQEPVSLQDYTPDDINYWLAVWINAYRHVLATAPDGCILFCYESLCSDPAATLGRLFDTAGLPLDTGGLDTLIRKPPAGDMDGASADLLEQAREIYRQLQARA
jgi:hypothetical protein